MKRRYFYKWVGQFKNHRISVTDEHRSGRPAKVSTPALQTRIDERRITVEIKADITLLARSSRTIKKALDGF